MSFSNQACISYSGILAPGLAGESYSLPRIHSFLVISSLALLFPLQFAWASHHFPDYPVRSADEYPNKAITAGLVVCVEPVEDTEQQKTYFNSRLKARGILPVFMVIRNISATDSYLFDKSTIGLGEATDINARGARKTASLLGSGGLVDLNLVNDASEVRENMMKKEIRSKTLAPGSSVNGFVYIPVTTDPGRKKIHLQVPLTNSQTGEIEVLNLFF